MTQRHGGQILVDQLRIHGVERVFCLPGESFLAALDGLYASEIDVVVGRQEGGVAMMAEATGKLTDRAGVAFVTRGPGATNASAGVHVAFQDSTPMVLFVGQVASDQRDREAFQEVDYRAMFGPLAKWVAEIDRTDRIPEYVARAFHVAQSGRPGPVVLALPEDMLSASADVADATPTAAVSGGVSDEDVSSVLGRLAEAERPFLLVGGGGWTAKARDDLAAFAEAFHLPVGAAFRCQDYLDNRHWNYVGDVGIGVNPELAARVREADLLLALGPRLGEMTTSGYTLLSAPTPSQTLIHVHSDPNEIGRVYHAALGIAARPAALLARLSGARPTRAPVWGERTRAARKAFEEWRVPQETPGALKMEQVVSQLSDRLPDNAIITNGAGNYSAWLHRYFAYKDWRTQLAPTSGSMGYGLPAAVAAKIAHPDRDVVCFAGDGCFQMSMQEFGVAAERGAAIIVLIADNGSYGTIRMHQERAYPGRVSGTKLVNPDFAALARSYGGFGATVSETEMFWPAFEEARSSGLPAILHLKLDPRALSPRLTLNGAAD